MIVFYKVVNFLANTLVWHIQRCCSIQTTTEVRCDEERTKPGNQVSLSSSAILGLVFLVMINVTEAHSYLPVIMDLHEYEYVIPSILVNTTTLILHTFSLSLSLCVCVHARTCVCVRILMTNAHQ